MTTEHTYIRETALAYKGQRRKIAGRITSSRDVAHFMRRVIPDAPQERMTALLLNTKSEPIGWTEIACGALAGVTIEPASVFRAAIIAGAHGLVLCHNHPSGNPTPSPEDVALTTRLRDAGDLLGIRVLDHVIITHGEGSYFSFLDAGLMGGAS